MVDLVSYEVYVYQDNNWELLGRYPSEERLKAVEYAKEVERMENNATKVVQERYDPSKHAFKETMIYLSQKSISSRRKKTSDDIPTVNIKAAKKPQQAASMAESMIMLSMSMFFSVIMAAVITAAVVYLLKKTDFFPEVSRQFTFGLFTFFFLLISIPVSIKWVNWNSFMQPKAPPKDDAASALSPSSTFHFSKEELYEMKNPPPSDRAKEKRDNDEAAEETEDDNTEEGTPPPAAAQPSGRSSFFSRIVRGIYNLIDVMTGKKTLAERLKEQEEKAMEKERRAAEKKERKEREEREKREKEEQEEKERQEREEKEKREEEEKKRKEREEKEKKETAEQEAAIEEKIKEEKQEENNKFEIPKEIEENYYKMTSFLSIILRVLQNRNILLNTFTRFGLELFLSGACECLCLKDKLTKDHNRLMLSNLLMLLGRTPNLAEIFYYKLDEYMLDSNYLAMIKNGTEAMRVYLENDTSPEVISLIESALDNWLNPTQKDAPSSGICTVMFTDIVSSTHITQMLGDHLAQQIIHLHNLIVRKALSSCGGTEVKHTGDGIMASFLWASNAVDAAIAIQKATQEYNAQSPTVPLEIRIGLNSGEPIVENNDLFGRTVQLASRVCGQAGANQIFVSSVVKELSSGKNYVFNSMGEFTLKGIDEPQTLYEVDWKNYTPAPEKTSELPETEPKQPVEEKEVDLSETLPQF